MLALFCCVFSAYAAQVKTDKAKGKAPSQIKRHETEAEKKKRWYVRFEGLNIYPELEDEKLLEGPINAAFRVLTPKHEGFETFSQQRDRAGLWAPQIGIGRDLGAHLSLFTAVGYSSDILRTNQCHPTLLLFPMRSSLEMRRGGTYVVLGADYYPFGLPDQRRYHGLVERLREAKPLAGIRVSYNRTVFDANMNLGGPPLNRLLHLRIDKAWGIFNFYPILGAEMPITRDTAISLGATYDYPSQQKRNLRGPGVYIALKCYFR